VWFVLSKLQSPELKRPKHRISTMERGKSSRRPSTGAPTAFAANFQDYDSDDAFETLVSIERDRDCFSRSPHQSLHNELASSSIQDNLSQGTTPDFHFQPLNSPSKLLPASAIGEHESFFESDSSSQSIDVGEQELLLQSFPGADQNRCEVHDPEDCRIQSLETIGQPSSLPALPDDTGGKKEVDEYHAILASLF